MDSWEEKIKWVAVTRKGNGQLGREKEMDSWDEKRKRTAGMRK
jgi:hypothetical protein